MKLLIVDDKESEILVKFFDIVGVEAIGFTTGTDALEWLEENKANTTLSDLAMVPSGISFVRDLRAAYPKMRIAFVTGHPPDDVIKRTAHKYGVEKIFEKGDDTLTLVRQIKDWLER